MILKTIASASEFRQAVIDCYCGMRNPFTSRTTHDFMEEFTVNMAERFSLHTDIADDIAMFWHASARSKKPALLVVSPNVGQQRSPSAKLAVRTEHALIQFFETGADDAGMAEDGTGVGYWIEEEGRVLQC